MRKVGGKVTLKQGKKRDKKKKKKKKEKKEKNEAKLLAGSVSVLRKRVPS